MREHTIIGMAGHIDHGKTALIKALTGIETDQHKEERERGITIDIGFAYWQDNITIIDVPGHEKFIRNMAAGVSALDLFILVIAADDGIMPQTIEHLEILKFFGARSGIVALNKTDLVDEEWQLLVEDEIKTFLSNYGYTDVPVIPVSAVKGSGIEELQNELKKKIDKLEKSLNLKPFRLNIDRSFVVKGFGSVITGTVLSSQVKAGDILTLLPQNRSVKVRGIQVHQSDAQQAIAGQRAAINIANVEKDELSRGTVLVEENSLKPCSTFLAKISTVANLKYKLKRYSKVRIHIGTEELLGKIYWFDEDKNLNPDSLYHMRIKLDEPGIAAPGDAVLIRSFSPVTTLAGGKVVFIDPPGVRQIEFNWEDIFNNFSNDDLITKIKQLFAINGFKSLTVKLIKQKMFENEADILRTLEQLNKQKYLVEIEYKNEKHYISQTSIDSGIGIIQKEIERALDKEKLKSGISLQQLSTLLKSYKFNDPFLERTLQKAVKAELLIHDGSLFTTKKNKDSGQTNRIQQKIIEIYKTNRFVPPELNEIAEELSLELKNIKNLVISLAHNGNLISIGGKFYLHREVLDELIEFIKSHFSKNTELDVANLRDFTDCSRKYIIPIFEYLDANGLTVRKEDVRTEGPNLN